MQGQGYTILNKAVFVSLYKHIGNIPDSGQGMLLVQMGVNSCSLCILQSNL